MARPGLTPDRIALAGLEVSDDIGFEKVTVTELARRFQVKPASLYSHIDGCSDLKARVARLAQHDLDHQISEALAGRAGKQALFAWANTYRDFAHTFPGRFAATQHPLDTAAERTHAGARQAQRMAAILREYDLPAVEEPHAARVIGCAIRGFVSVETFDEFSSNEPDPEQSWARMLDALDFLLRSWPARTGQSVDR